MKDNRRLKKIYPALYTLCSGDHNVSDTKKVVISELLMTFKRYAVFLSTLLLNFLQLYALLVQAVGLWRRGGYSKTCRRRHRRDCVQSFRDARVGKLRRVSIRWGAARQRASYPQLRFILMVLHRRWPNIQLAAASCPDLRDKWTLVSTNNTMYSQL